MIIKAVLKSDVDKVPYRVYINDELITERLYTQAPTNTLVVELVDQDNYNIQVVSLDSTASVTLENFTMETNNALA